MNAKEPQPNPNPDSPAILPPPPKSHADSVAAGGLAEARAENDRLRELLQAAEARAAELRETLDRFDAQAAAIYADTDYKWQYCEAIGCLIEDAPTWKTENAELRRVLESTPMIGSMAAIVFSVVGDDEPTQEQREIGEWLDARRKALGTTTNNERG